MALLTLKPLYQCAGAFFIPWQKSLPDKHHFMAAMPSPALATVAGFFIWANNLQRNRKTMATAQNSKIKAKGKPRGKPIAKGQVLNAGGRPKKTEAELDLIAACKAKTPSALAVMSEIMENGEKEATRLQAALAIIERAYGKPVQPQDVNLSGMLLFQAIERRIVQHTGN